MPAPLATARAALWVALLAFVVRVLYLTEHARSAFFGVPILDEAYYDGLALALLGQGSDAAVMNPGFRPWGYPLFLAGAHRLADPFGRPLAVAIQHVLGITTAILVVWLAARLLRSATGGALAGTLYVLAGPPLFFEGELLITSGFTFLLTVIVAVFGRLGDDGPTAPPIARSTIRWLTAGVWCGLAIQARANAVLVVGLLPMIAWVADRRHSDHRRLLTQRLIAAAVGLFAVLTAFAGFQQHITGRFGLLPSAGGVNLYLGNKQGADGMVPRQDWQVTYAETYRDSVEVFAAEGFRRAHPEATPTPAAISQYWRKRAVAEVTAQPTGWGALILRKISYLTWNREIPNNKRYSFVAAEESPVLAALPVRWWLLLALGPLGAWYAWRRGDRRRLVWLLGVVGCHAAGVVLFFVTGRYRIPLWPLLCILAAGGCLWLVDTARQRAGRRLVAGLAVTAVAATIALVPRSDASWPSLGRDYFFRSIAWLEQGQPDQAMADARKSVEFDPTDGAAWLQLGNALEALEQPREALEAYERARALSPGEPRIANNVGVVLEALGQPIAAYASYQRALALSSEGYAPALINAALIELRAGLDGQADTKIERALASGFDSISLRCAQALMARVRGNEPRFTSLLAPIQAEHPEAVARILNDHAQTLDTAALRAEDEFQ